MSDALAYLDALLRARLVITEARQLRLSPPDEIRDGIVPTPRLILLRSGRIHYQLEEKTLDISPGTMLLVPAFSRRAWSAPRTATVNFFSFQTEPTLPSPGVMIRRIESPGDTSQSMTRLLKLTADPSRAATLLAEAKAKHLLAEFLTVANPIGDASPPAVVGSKSIATALQWLTQNLAHADPLGELPQRTGQSENQLRRQFKSLLGQSPRDYLFALRMRQARFHLVETTIPVKQIARSVGYDDPHYFSRRYHHFWNRWPTDERT